MRPLWVCSVLELTDHVRELQAGWVVSVVGPDDQPLTPPGIVPEHHLRIEVDDVVEPRPDAVLAGEQHVRTLIDFFREPGDGRPVVVHCLAGISRSWAAAFIAMALESDGRELDAARALREAAPHAFPNRRLVALADHLLERDGRLIHALAMMPPGRPAGWGRLTKVPLLAG